MTTVTPPPVPISAAAPVALPRGAPDRRMVVTGGARLRGEIAAGGAKNAATKMMASCLLTREPVLLEHVPDIEAVHTQESDAPTSKRDMRATRVRFDVNLGATNGSPIDSTSRNVTVRIHYLIVPGT